MKITIEISDKRVTDLLHGHGGGSSPWMRKLTGKWNVRRGAVVLYDREEDDEGTGRGRVRIGPRAVERGLAIMAMKSPHAFATFMDENDDDIDFDTAWQCIIFGKLVYG